MFYRFPILFYIVMKPKIPLLPFAPVANPIGKKSNNDKKLQKTNSFKTEDSGDIMNEKEENKQKEMVQKQIINNNFANHVGSKIENNLMNYGNIANEDDRKFKSAFIKSIEQSSNGFQKWIFICRIII